MSKYRTWTIHYPQDQRFAAGVLGEYINELHDKGFEVIQIVNWPKHEVDPEVHLPKEPEYTAVRGNNA